MGEKYVNGSYERFWAQWAGKRKITVSSAVDPGKLFFTADNTVSSAVDPGKLFFTADNSSELGILYNSWSLKSYTSVCIEIL